MNDRQTIARAQRRSLVLLLAPMLLVLAAVAAWPLLRTVWIGLTDATLSETAPARWLGLANFLSRLEFGAGDGEWDGLLVDEIWWQAVRNTLVFTGITVTAETILGLAIALLLNRRFPLRGLVRAAVLVPWAIPTVVSAKLWAWMLNDQFGILNVIGLQIGLIAEPVAWLASPDTALLAIMLVDVWKSTPFMVLLILAGLQLIPASVYEAARIDGAGPLRTFRHITLPLVMPALLVAVTFRILDALRVFDVVYVLSPGNDSTRTMSVFVHENLIQFDRFGYGSAAATLLFLVVALITVVYLRAVRLNVD